DWKPHPKSMPLGYLAALVAKMPSWIEMIIELDEYELKPSGPSRYGQQPARTTRELVQLFEESLAAGRAGLAGMNDEHLMKSWRLLVNGRVVSEQVRHIALTDAVLSHWAHHCGQLGSICGSTTSRCRHSTAPRPTRVAFEPSDLLNRLDS